MVRARTAAATTTTYLEVSAHGLEDLEAELHDGPVGRRRVEQQSLTEVVPHGQDELLRAPEARPAVVHDSQQHFLRRKKAGRDGKDKGAVSVL